MKTLVNAVLFSLMLLLLAPLSFAQEHEGSARTDWDDGIFIHKSDDGNYLIRFDTRAYLNGGYFFEDDNRLSSGTHIRKGRFALKTQLYKVWRLEWDIDVAEGEVEIKDMYISFVGLENSHIKLGHFKMPLGLNELMTSRYQTFIERAYPMLAFETDRHMGLQYSRWGEKWNLRAAVFGQSMDTEKNKTVDETGNGAAVRFAAAPIKRNTMFLHTGLALAYQRPDNSGHSMEFQSEPETKLGDPEILSTGTIFDIKYSMKTGLEGALIYKNFSLQSEYIQTNLSRMNGAEDATLSGGYAFVSWVLTGESRPWVNEEGELGRIIPKSNTLGAWELAARYSHLNLTDDKAGITGGKANNFTFGLNWYANPNIRFLLNYTYVDNSIFATNDGFPGDYDFSVIHFMAIFYF